MRTGRLPTGSHRPCAPRGGCCSDFNEAFLLRAQAVGLQARETHNQRHTTAEYYNQERGRWIWIDSSNRIQIADYDGQLVSAWRRRQREPWTNLQLVRLPPSLASAQESLRSNPAFLSRSNAVLYWTPAWDPARLDCAGARRVGISPAPGQLASERVGGNGADQDLVLGMAAWG